MIKKTLIIIFGLIVTSNAISSEIVVSIKPLHSLVSAVTEGSNSVSLVIDGSMTPHNFALKPSHAKLLNNAKVLFYIDDEFESGLKKTVKGLPKSVKVIRVSKMKKLRLLSTRADDNWEEDGHDHHDHGHSSNDLHFWLDPNNAIEIVKSITQELSAIYPENINIYKKNAKNIIKEIKTTDLLIKSMLEPVRNKPYIVFHDAYQYFENRFGIQVLGALTVNTDVMPGAEQLSEIREVIEHEKVNCLFSEPQFNPSIIKSIAKDTSVKIGILDPLGSKLDKGKDLYFNLLNNMASSFKGC